MTRSNAILYFNAWADKNLLRHGERATGLDFVYDLYEDGCEIVDRTIDEDTARREEKKVMTKAEYEQLEKDIADSLNFDNELSQV